MAEEIRDEEKGTRPLSYRTTLFLKLIIVALLIAPAMLVAPPLLVAFLMVSALPLFAVACYLGIKLGENKKTKIKDRFGDVVIGIISGLVASHLMWVLLTFGETPILALQSYLSALYLLVVVFSIVVILEYVLEHEMK